MPDPLLALAAIAGLSPEQIEGINNTIAQGLLIASNELVVVDTNGNRLQKGETYRFVGDKAKRLIDIYGELAIVIDAQFGSGNIMDTYYRLYFIGQKTMQMQRFVVDPKWENKLKIYIAPLEPITTEESE